MRIFLLLLISMCVFAADADVHLPSGKDLPGWAKDLNKKFERAAGENAPWRKMLPRGHETEAGYAERHIAETEYRNAFETARENFAKNANLKNIIKGSANEVDDYKTGLVELERRKGKDWRHDASQWMSANDEFYIAYAQLNHDPLALAFLWIPKNRDLYINH